MAADANQALSPGPPLAIGLHFEHYTTQDQLGTHIPRPRLSWTFTNSPGGFQQRWYELEIYDKDPATAATDVVALYSARVESNQSVFVPWPLERDLQSRERVFARVRAGGDSTAGNANGDGKETDVISAWSRTASIEAGLIDRQLWQAKLITAPWTYPADDPSPEELYRTQFTIGDSDKTGTKSIRSARLYITAQGVYEAEINGTRVGYDFMAPGWTVYGSRLRYQCFDVLAHLGLRTRDQKSNSTSSSNSHVLGVRLAEGWFCGRLSFNGGSRNMFGERPALMAQVEIGYDDGTVEIVASTGDAGPSEWWVTQGPIRKAEIYDGEKYDARLEVDGWSELCHSRDELPKVPSGSPAWQKAASCGALPAQIELLTGEAEPVRRIETIQASQELTTPSGKTIIDFGQNLVGYVRIVGVSGPAGTVVSLRHAEVLEHGELGTRPLRFADNCDEYTLKGEGKIEQWEPRFTFHGFRYLQVDGWPPTSSDGTTNDLFNAIEAVVCHTDMIPSGTFTCSDILVSHLHHNVTWSMRGNFVSVPTDCPQRDERLGWTGDLAMFAPTAALLYKCSGMLQGWLRDVAAEQAETGGIPPLVVPNVLKKDPHLSHVMPCAVWGDVAVLAPWALYQATGDLDILRNQYASMAAWVSVIPRNKKNNNKHLWDYEVPQLGDWLDPTAPPDNPAGGKTDSILVADAFLIHILDVIAQAATLLDKPTEAEKYQSDAAAARSEFAYEYILPSGRMMSDSQTAYALAIVFNLFPRPAQYAHACARLIELVRRNSFRIGTGFAGTPYILEALTIAGAASQAGNDDRDGGSDHENIGAQVAYMMLHNTTCPSWLYSVTMGATTIWERYDSMLPDGSINPGEMTSFNHYALGAVARWLYERVAGLQRLEAGWRRMRIAPLVGGEMTHARASHVSPYGEIVSEWRLLEPAGEGGDEAKSGSPSSSSSSPSLRELKMDIVVPPNTSAEVVFPKGSGREPCEVGAGKHSFRVPISKHTWPIEAIRFM